MHSRHRPGVLRCLFPQVRRHLYAYMDTGQKDMRCGATLSCARHGADLNVDVPYAYLTYLLDDDAELKRIGEEYGSGRMLTGEVPAGGVPTVLSCAVRALK